MNSFTSEPKAIEPATANEIRTALELPEDAEGKTILDAIFTLRDGNVAAQERLRDLDAAEHTIDADPLEAELADYNLSPELTADLLAMSEEMRARFLSALPKQSSGSGLWDALPPKPTHDPASWDQDVDQRAAAAETLIREVKKEGKFTDYTSAREEARRREPGLFR